jgi:hypothetical protein
LFLEGRDTIRQTLAPALQVSHLLSRGREIAKAFTVIRKKRPLQEQKIRKILGKS